MARAPSRSIIPPCKVSEDNVTEPPLLERYVRECRMSILGTLVTMVPLRSGAADCLRRRPYGPRSSRSDLKQ